MNQKYQHSLKSLKNTLVCSYHRIFKIKDYPLCILPKANYLIDLNIDELVEKYDLFLLRRSNLSSEQSFGMLGKDFILKESAIDDVRLPNLSLNLLGGKFISKHAEFVIKLKTTAENKWSGEKVYLYEHLNSYSKIQGHDLIFIRANKIHNVDFPYELKYDRNIQKDIDKYKSVFGEKIVSNKTDAPHSLIAKIMLIHAPINLNYWHIELKINDFMNASVESTKSAKNKQIASQVLSNLIIINAYPQQQEIQLIDKKYYIKN